MGYPGKKFEAQIGLASMSGFVVPEPLQSVPSLAGLGGRPSQSLESIAPSLVGVVRLAGGGTRAPRSAAQVSEARLVPAELEVFDLAAQSLPCW